jgi:hypothetical protein
MNERFNYIRRGANWDHFLNNLKELKQHHFKWRVNLTFSVCSALHLLDTFEFFKYNFDISDFTINRLEMDHTSIRARNLPLEIKKQCISKYKEFMSITLDDNLKGQLTNCIDELNQTNDESYVTYLDYIDSLENTNWKLIFPELLHD